MHRERSIAPFPVKLKIEPVRPFRQTGKGLEEVAGSLGVSTNALHEWVERDDVEGGARPGLKHDEREELERPRRKNRILLDGREILRRSAGFYAGYRPRPFTDCSRVSTGSRGQPPSTGSSTRCCRWEAAAHAPCARSSGSAAAPLRVKETLGGAPSRDQVLSWEVSWQQQPRQRAWTSDALWRRSGSAMRSADGESLRSAAVICTVRWARIPGQTIACRRAATSCLMR